MSKRGWAILGLAVAMLAVCLVSALSVYGVLNVLQSSGARVRLLDFSQTPATRRETKEYRAAKSPNLVVNSSAGGITVTTGAEGVIQVEMVRTAYGRDKEAAREALDRLEVAVSEQGGTLTLTYSAPAEVVVIGDKGAPDTVGFNIVVPPATTVKLAADMGDVNLHGTRAEAWIATRFGATVVEDVAGALGVAAEFGSVTVALIRAGDGEVNLVARFGDLQVRDVVAGRIRLDAHHGSLGARNLTARNGLVAENEFGEILLEDVEVDLLTAETNHGALLLHRGTVAGLLSAGTAFGNLAVEGVTAGRYELDTRNGELEVSGSRGPLRLRNAFGNIRVDEARAATLDIESNNGQIEVAAELDPDQAHTVQGSFGNVTLTIPGESRLDLLLEADRGTVRTTLPVTVSGEASEDRMAGTLNGGGPLLRLRTANGDVRLERMSPATGR